MKLKSGFGLVAAAVLASCGVGDLEEQSFELADTEVTESSSAELSAFSRTYVTVRRDYRKCMFPYCGGYWVRDLNRVKLKEVYVVGLDFSKSGLPQHAIDAANAAGDFELVLRGKLGPLHKPTRTRAFIVSEAYRGMPGVQVAPGELYYRAAPRNPSIQCFTAPCPNEIATRLNSTRKTAFDGYDVQRAALPLVDQSWLVHSVRDKGAIVAAKFSQGQQFPGGFESILDASQVFIRLPEVQASCPQVRLAPCPAGEAWTYARSEERCVLPESCVVQGVCAQYFPTCPAGYALKSWTAAPHACPAFVCDPEFIDPPIRP